MPSHQEKCSFLCTSPLSERRVLFASSRRPLAISRRTTKRDAIDFRIVSSLSSPAHFAHFPPPKSMMTVGHCNTISSTPFNFPFFFFIYLRRSRVTRHRPATRNTLRWAPSLKLNHLSSPLLIYLFFFSIFSCPSSRATFFLKSRYLFFSSHSLALKGIKSHELNVAYPNAAALDSFRPGKVTTRVE